jgi:hypothetical protein
MKAESYWGIRVAQGVRGQKRNGISMIQNRNNLHTSSLATYTIRQYSKRNDESSDVDSGIVDLQGKVKVSAIYIALLL